ncbi:hypothetical protein RB195_009213 [Necator americanus]|uniref:SXP/RAL-2 family protein Ani s 5-like cation-binding domain-containing protein n=1 Tax=Necator americanus TaxID=51031 RepID=A0ABR1CSZ6_NECAM
MKIALAILIITTTVLCQQGGWNGLHKNIGHGGRNGPHGMMPPPSFLQGASQDAQREFFAISSNTGLTIAQQKQEVQKWAQKYGLVEQVRDFDEKTDRMRSIVNENVRKLLAELPFAVERVSAIMANKDQTVPQLHSAVKALNDENPKLYQVVGFMMQQSMPWHQAHGGPTPAPSGTPGVGMPQQQRNFHGFENKNNFGQGTPHSFVDTNVDFQGFQRTHNRFGFFGNRNGMQQAQWASGNQFRHF